jgi:hypothetical protein
MTTELEAQIEQWRSYVQRQQAIASTDVDEMDGHLRDQVADLISSGLSEDEAFLVAVKRMGRLDDISREFAREHSERLWKQLVLSGADDEGSPGASGIGSALAFAVAAAVAVRVAMELLPDAVLARNISLIVLPFITGYFAWTRRSMAAALAGITTFGLGALALNLYPWMTATGAAESTTEILAATHLPIVLWIAVGVAYVGSDWRSHARRMDFIRFTGEWVVYIALLALGGIALTGLTIGAFSALDVGSEDVIASWIVPLGAAGATVVAAWLVEAKQAVVENIAPVLTKVFTPLTVAMLVAVLVGFVAKFTLIDVDRGLLILMDLVLVLVLGLILYAISARDPLQEAGWFDRLQVVLLLAALAADAVMLVTMVARIADAGFTANKVAALGVNLVLLVNLAWSTRLAIGFVRGRTPFATLERWQTTYLPVYGLWAAFVVLALPPIFGFA